MRYTTRTLIRDFNTAFDRPVNTVLTGLSVSERELLGKLLFEEVVEYVTKGLGLVISDDSGNALAGRDDEGGAYDFLTLSLDEGQQLDPIECADGLGDVNVVIHFAAHWQGINLDRVTQAIHESNMSKLGEDGKPIINDCINAASTHMCPSDSCLPRDQTRPIGKILKGPNFKPPTDAIKAILDEGNF